MLDRKDTTIFSEISKYFKKIMALHNLQCFC